MSTELKFRPMPGKVIVEVKPQDEATSGKIILIQSTREPPTMGTVIAVPEDAIIDGQEITPVVAVGDVVVFGKYSGSELTFSNNRAKKLICLREVDILTIIEQGAPDIQEAIPSGAEPIEGEDPLL